MFTTEFQAESPTSAAATADGTDQCLLRRRSGMTRVVTNETEIPCQHCEDRQSLLGDLALAMQLRDGLNQHEQSLLDTLAGRDAVSFLIAGEQYLHPADTPLFAPELVETTRNMGGEAVFTQRYRPQSEQSENTYVLHSALVGTRGEHPVVFGLLSPEGATERTRQESDFCATACAFRRSFRAAETATTNIRRRLDDDRPAMVVSQATGRVLAVNRPLVRMVGIDSLQVTELSFEEVRELLARFVGRMRISLETLAVGEQSVSVVTFSRETAKATSEHKVTEFFAHKMRNKLAGITTAASQWLSMKGETIDESSLELADIVLSEAAALNWQLDRLMAYLQSQDQPRRSIALSEELMLAIHQIRGIATDRQPAIEWDENADLGRISAPPITCCALFEAVLLRHLAAGRVPITISFDRPKKKPLLHLVVQSEYVQSAYSQDELDVHTMYARRLAQVVGIDLLVTPEEADGTLRTELMITLSTAN
jgi:hypothetical protein